MTTSAKLIEARSGNNNVANKHLYRGAFRRLFRGIRHRVIPFSALVAALAFAGCGTAAESATASDDCGPRTVIIDASSSARSDDRQAFVAEVAHVVAVRGAVCAEPTEILSVAGPGVVKPLLTAADVAAETPAGPNLTIRRSRFDSEASARLRTMIDDALTQSYQTLAADQTSLSAMLAVAADHKADGSHFVVMTDGVNNDELLDLNQPLVLGDGHTLAQAITVPDLSGARLTFVGVGQVDSPIPAPGPIWENEVRAFVTALCTNSGASECVIKGSSSIEGLLT